MDVNVGLCGGAVRCAGGVLLCSAVFFFCGIHHNLVLVYQRRPRSQRPGWSGRTQLASIQRASAWYLLLMQYLLFLRDVYS